MKTIKILPFLLLATSCFGQKNFEINLTAKDHINDSIGFEIPRSKIGFENIYRFFPEGENVSELSYPGSIPNIAYQILIKDKNIIKGSIEYPIRVFFTYMDKEKGSFGVVKPFWLDAGNYTIDLPKLEGPVIVPVNTPADVEFNAMQKLLDPAYKRAETMFAQDSLLSLATKTELLNNYITQHPNSYIALWEVFDDYNMHKNLDNYATSMGLFSDKMKMSSLYKKINDKIQSIMAAGVGTQFPDIKFDGENSLTLADLKKHKLTFIDYWATSCGPCIKGMPDILKLYNEFNGKGVNFITVTDENEPKRMKMAADILAKNNINWTNYYDINKDFSEKLSATGYPMQLVLDSNGTIIGRFGNNLDAVRETFVKNLK